MMIRQNWSLFRAYDFGYKDGNKFDEEDEDENDSIHDDSKDKFCFEWFTLILFHLKIFVLVFWF